MTCGLKAMFVQFNILQLHVPILARLDLRRTLATGTDSEIKTQMSSLPRPTELVIHPLPGHSACPSSHRIRLEDHMSHSCIQPLPCGNSSGAGHCMQDSSVAHSASPSFAASQPLFLR